MPSSTNNGWRAAETAITDACLFWAHQHHAGGYATNADMQWYYMSGGERRGPVGAEQFQRLVQQGTITPQTRVWRERMKDWQTQEPDARPTDQNAGADVVKCAECGGHFSRSEVVVLTNQSYCAACKPIVVQRMREGVGASSSAEATRKQYLKHEASVQSVGMLYRIGAILMVFAAILQFSVMWSQRAVSVGGLVFALFMAVAGFIVGTGLRRLQSWARVPTGILSGLGLLAFPLGTIINAYILYLVFCRKGRVVFSDEYRAVIAQTPHIRYRTSLVIWIAVVFIVLVLVAAALMVPLMGRRGG